MFINAMKGISDQIYKISNDMSQRAQNIYFENQNPGDIVQLSSDLTTERPLHKSFFLKNFL
jgi:hypothetical protein